MDKVSQQVSSLSCYLENGSKSSKTVYIYIYQLVKLTKSYHHTKSKTERYHLSSIPVNSNLSCLFFAGSCTFKLFIYLSIGAYYKLPSQQHRVTSGLFTKLRPDWAVKKEKLCFKLCLSLMLFLCTVHLKRLIAVKNS